MSLPQTANERSAGFTLVEILMVTALVGILAAVALPQFIDFRGEAADAAVQNSVGSLRSAIVNQMAQMRLRCNATTTIYPTVAQLNANDITASGSPCTAAMIPNAAERKFITGDIPDNTLGGATPRNNVEQCVGANTGCNQNDNTDCSGNPYKAASGGCVSDALLGVSTGWCYNPANGKIWANSANSGGTTKEHNF